MLFLDFETASAVDLKAKSGRFYAHHDSTSINSLVWFDGAAWSIWAPACPFGWDELEHHFRPYYVVRTGPFFYHNTPEPPSSLLTRVREGRTLVAHNAFGFDGFIWSALMPEEFQYDQWGNPVCWWDTIPCCNASGLPASLQQAAIEIGYSGKHEKGKQANKLLMKRTWDGEKWVQVPGTTALWAQMLAYNVDDVFLLEKIWSETCLAGEDDVMDNTIRINEEGVRFDRDFLCTLDRIWSSAEMTAGYDIERLTNGRVPRDKINSIPKIRSWCELMGVKVGNPFTGKESIDKQSVDALEARVNSDNCGENDELVLTVLKLRQTATGSAKGKIATAIRQLHNVTGGNPSVDGYEPLPGDDDNAQTGLPEEVHVLKDWCVYHRAHTGRFSSFGVQLHNLPRGIDYDLSYLVEGGEPLTTERVLEAAINYAKEEELSNPPLLSEVLSTMFRPAIQAFPEEGLLIADYAQIEARVAAWCCDDELMLSAFREDRDPYVAMAAPLFEVREEDISKPQRHVGKTLVLGAGYGMSGRRFASHCAINGISLKDVGIDPNDTIKRYRSIVKNPQGWRDCNDWFFAVARGDRMNVPACKCHFRREGSHVYITLPSGRDLIYRNTEIYNGIPGWAKFVPYEVQPRDCVKYKSNRGYEVDTYGGKIFENIVQAISRDLLALALIHLEQAGYKVMFHVHDEIITRIPYRDPLPNCQRALEIMVTSPAWADGIPVKADGFLSDRFYKECPATARERKLEAKNY